MKKTLFTLASFFLALSMCAQDSIKTKEKFPRVLVGVLFIPQISWFKSETQNVERPDISYWVGPHWGWGGLKGSANIGLRVAVNITNKVSVITGLADRKFGTKMQYSWHAWYWDEGQHPAPLGQLDSSYMSRPPGFCKLGEREYIVRYLTVPVNLHFKTTPPNAKSALYVVAGPTFYFLQSATATDRVTMMGISPRRNIDVKEDMQKNIVCLALGLDSDIHLKNRFYMNAGWQYSTSLSNIMKKESVQLLDSEKTEKSFAKNGPAIPFEQHFVLKALSITLGLSYAF